MIFSVRPHGNIGNRMLAFMLAASLARRLGRDVRYNASLPEWGMGFDPALHGRACETGAPVITDANAATLEEMAARITGSGADHVVFDGFFQRFAYLAARAQYRDVFPLQPLDIAPFAEDELVINIRAGELRGGQTPWYPLVPPAFYHMLASRTGLRPVLLGQLDDGPYTGLIRHLLPEARLIPSGGAMADFNRLRYARHLCIAVSTFSWLAAWLGEAAQIHYPVLGFLHPFTMPPGTHGTCGTNLTPLGDARYRYHLFPMLHALPELDYLHRTAQFSPPSLPVTEDFMARLCARADAYRGPRRGNAVVSGAYTALYPDAAWSIALGHFISGREHYEQVGRHLGYQGYRLHDMQGIAWRQQRPDLALHKPALQSSASPWSHHPDPADDASGAVNGEIDEFYGFHTGEDEVPWWRVDLGASFRIEEIWLFNRMEFAEMALRAAALAVDIGASEDEYREVFRRVEDTGFGGVDGKPLIIRLAPGEIGRFVRVRLLRRDFLHLSEVEIYGTALPPDANRTCYSNTYPRQILYFNETNLFRAAQPC